MDVRFRPLVWTSARTPAHKKRGPNVFKAGWTDTLYKLEDELGKLKATEIIIEADFSEADLRIDGWPRAGARPTFHGVRISFNAPKIGRVQYETDVCEFWQHNVRSIALGLEALRAVDRYGITSGMQQYTGFKAIGVGNGMTSKAEAAQVIADLSGLVVSGQAVGRDPNVANAAYRAAAKRLHPDNPETGSAELFKKLEQAKAVLEL